MPHLFQVLRKLKRRGSAAPARRPPLTQRPDVSGKTFLFIGGLHRSGTSVLHRLLCEHPNTSGFSGTGAKEDEGQHLQSVFPPAKCFGGAGRFAFNPSASLTIGGEPPSAMSREQLLREWGAYYDLGKQVLIEKSPPNLIRAEYFRQLLPLPLHSPSSRYCRLGNAEMVEDIADRAIATLVRGPSADGSRRKRE